MSEPSPARLADRPRVRLRPQADARRIRHGFPWVYDSEMVTDRRTRARPSGSLAVLEDPQRAPLGTVALSPGSRIIARLLDRDPAAEIDAAWIAARLARAQAHRHRLYERPYYRLVHAEADQLPGLVIDRFGDTVAVQPNAAWAERRFDAIIAALQDTTGVANVIKNGNGRARRLEGLDDVTCVAAGALDAPVAVEMNGATYFADLIGGQKTGLFFDQRENHAAAARLAAGARVLDLFCHVGGFALAALAAGARGALAVDASAPALELARRGAEASGFGNRFAARHGDAFEVLAALAEEGERYDVVISDPPAFAPQRTALETGLRAYDRLARRAAALVVPGGYLVLCSCSHAAGLDKFRAACVRGIGRAGRAAQLVRVGFAAADHPQHPMLPESGYLKALTFRLL